MATATWALLRDKSWGIRVQGTVTAGSVVTVTKKDGTTSTVTVGRIVWQGDGVTLATAASSSTARGASAGGSRRSGSRCSGCRCHREPNAGAPGSIQYDGCDYCGCES